MISVSKALHKPLLMRIALATFLMFQVFSTACVAPAAAAEGLLGTLSGPVHHQGPGSGEVDCEHGLTTPATAFDSSPQFLPSGLLSHLPITAASIVPAVTTTLGFAAVRWTASPPLYLLFCVLRN